MPIVSKLVVVESMQRPCVRCFAFAMATYRNFMVLCLPFDDVTVALIASSA